MKWYRRNDDSRESQKGGTGKARNAQTYYANLQSFPDTFGAMVMLHAFLKTHLTKKKNSHST